MVSSKLPHGLVQPGSAPDCLVGGPVPDGRPQLIAKLLHTECLHFLPACGEGLCTIITTCTAPHTRPWQWGLGLGCSSFENPTSRVIYRTLICYKHKIARMQPLLSLPGNLAR